LDKPISLHSLKSKLPQDILQLMNESIAINSTAHEHETKNGERTFIDSATEATLLRFFLDLNLLDIKSLRENYKIIQLFTFNSERKVLGLL